MDTVFISDFELFLDNDMQKSPPLKSDQTPPLPLLEVTKFSCWSQKIPRIVLKRIRKQLSNLFIFFCLTKFSF